MSRSIATALIAIAFVSAATSRASAECGDADFNGKVAASDSLAVLQTAVDLRLCEPCACDYSGNGTIAVDDALLILKKSVSSGSPPAEHCPVCTEAVCGDGILAPYHGRPFTILDLGQCEALDYDEPWVILDRALDTKFHDVTDKVELHVDNSGCICQSVDRATVPAAKKRAAVRTPVASTDSDASVTTTSTSSSTSGSLYCGDCLFDVWIESQVPLTLVEVEDLASLCWLGASAPLVEEDEGIPGGDLTRVHAQIVEQCDDGNTENGDGCTSDCKLGSGDVGGE